MKALYGKNALKPAIRKEVERESARQYQEIQSTIQKDISVQLIAVMLYTLNVCEGFGKTRIQRVFHELGGTFEDMKGAGFAGKFDADDLVDLVKEKFGIDLIAEIKCKQCASRKR